MNSISNIRAVTFDVGGTLITPWPSVGHVYSEMAEKFGIRIPPGVLNKRFSTAWKQRLEFNHSREAWRSIVQDTFSGLTDVPPGRLEFFDELYDRFGEPEVWKIFEDSLPAIDELLSRGVRLGIISNWDERLRPLLSRLKLAQYFDTIIISCEMGFSKPSPVLFAEASRKLGVIPKHILHVGDSPKHDGEGSESGGFQWRIIDRSPYTDKASTIPSLMKLAELI